MSKKSGDLFNELAIATAISSAIATLVMGLLANYPFALAPGMGSRWYLCTAIRDDGVENWRLSLHSQVTLPSGNGKASPIVFF
jgi:AGZA family xanthine/uracil permease-like MFS transporter